MSADASHELAGNVGSGTDAPGIASRGAPRFRARLGVYRFSRGLGLAAAAGAGLLVAYRTAVPLAARVAERTWNAKLASEAIWGVIEGPDAKAGLVQFYVFAIVMAFTFAAAVAFALGHRGVERLPRGRALGVGADLAAVVGVSVAASRVVSPATGWFVAACVAGTGMGIAVYCGVGRMYERPASERAHATLVLIPEALCLAWGLYQAHREQWGAFAFIVALAVTAAAAWRAGRGGVGLVRDAVAGVPLLLLPWVELRRAPSPLWPYAALGLALAVRAALPLVPRLRSLRRVPTFLPSWFAPVAVIAIFVLPLRFRELASVSHNHHEAFHLGWLSSMTYGKFMFADAALMYGPAREYLLALVARVQGGGGFTLEHVRIAHLVLNLGGAAALLAAGWRVARGNMWAFSLWAYLVVTRSPIIFFLNDDGTELNFGWADIARLGLGVLALVGTLDAMRPFDGSVRAKRTLVAWGGLAGFSTLYSHDVGLIVLLTTMLSLGVDTIAQRRKPGSLRRAAEMAGSYIAGAGGVLGLFVLVYVVCGRGRALLDTLVFVREVSAGAFGAAVYPLSVTDFVQPGRLFADVGGFSGCRLNYVLPPAILVVGLTALVGAAAYGRWSWRTTRLTGLFLLACGIYRYALFRTDQWHVCMGATPTYLLLVALVTDAWPHRFHLGFPRVRLRVPAIALALAALTCVGVEGMEVHDRGLLMRARHIASGDEHPSAAQPYHYDLPRAGDEHVPDGTLRMVHYVREHTRERDPIWVLTDFLDGGEIYFLAQRRNPTRYDFWSEVPTKYEARLALQQIEHDPPVLIIGHGWRQYIPEITAFVNAHYKVVETLDGVEIRRFNDAPTATP